LNDRGRAESIFDTLRVYTVLRFLTSSHFMVSGKSMTPAFQPGDRLLVNRLFSNHTDMWRGDVVVTRDLRNSQRLYLKRVIGLPGEDVHIFEGNLFVNNVQLQESYVHEQPASLGLDDRRWTLGDEQYFVMGDNRLHSTDSRDFGALDKRLFVGRVWFRYWPLEEWGSVNQQKPYGPLLR